MLGTEPFWLPLLASGTVHPRTSFLRLRFLSSSHASGLISSPYVHSPWPCTVLAQGPRKLYGTAGTVNSIPLLKVGHSVCFPSHFWWPDVPKMHQIAHICNYFPGKYEQLYSLDPPNWGGHKALPLDDRTPSHFSVASSAAVLAQWHLFIGHFNRPGRCPEIPDILKFVLKFKVCPEILTHVLKFVKAPVSLWLTWHKAYVKSLKLLLSDVIL